eukprot:1160368-Pleurochrysis_carterae.AAC.1
MGKYARAFPLQCTCAQQSGNGCKMQREAPSFETSGQCARWTGREQEGRKGRESALHRKDRKKVLRGRMS